MRRKNNNNLENLLIKIEQANIKIGVLGLGYTGLPLALAFAKRYKVIGFDTNCAA